MTDDATQRAGFRGKCLYKTGKCNNERALKTSGQAHNLCDEHRHRQNEHQRKLDAKNRYARKDKRGSKEDSPTGAMAVAAAAAAAARGQRYSPYAKAMRMSPNAANGQDDVHGMLGRNGIVASSAMTPPMMQFHSMGGGDVAGASQMGMPQNASSSGAPEILPSGVVILPNGPQAPQMPYPTAMQDFDGIVVPLPSYLEGHERVEFRSRIYQKVLDFIAEECMRRFGAASVMASGISTLPAQPQHQPQQQQQQQQQSGTSRGSELMEVAQAASIAEAAEEHSANAKQQPRAAKAGETQETERKSSSASRGDQDSKDSDDSQPEDPEEDGEEDADVEAEAEAAARSKRTTRSRLVRKEV